MQAKQMMLGLLGSAILGGGVAVGGYKLLEPERPYSPQAIAADPNVRYTSELRSSTYTVPEGLNFTAAAALDDTTPRYLRVAGEVASIRGVQAAASQALGKPFKLLRVGSLGVLATMINVTRTLMPAPNDVFPPWQGMQYMHNMLSGQAKLNPLDTARYPDIRYTQIRELLAEK